MPPEKCFQGGTIDRPEPFDWPFFLRWAMGEGWRVPSRELALYRKEFAASSFVWRDAMAVPLGFVTVCRHQDSAWVGNLIVDPQYRGKGVGRALFHSAINHLASHGVTSFWLTASADGRPLYESCGFSETRRIERWVWSGSRAKSEAVAAGHSGQLHALLRADAAAWGCSRGRLLSLLAQGGRIVSSGSTVAMLQLAEGLSVLGPWFSADLCPRSNRTVLAGLLDSFGGDGEIAADLIGGSPVRTLLPAAGFSQTGETVLMVRGAPGPVKFSEIVALASLGSMG